jgi:hypothetical protein
MSCRPRTSAEFEARMVEESARVLYTPRDEKSSFSATVHFNLDEDLLADTMMTIESMTADLRAGNGLIYRGPYKKSILLRLGSELLDDGGLGVDSLSFRFFDRGSHEICIQEQDSDAQYWKPNANVYIDFLDHRELDPEIGTPIGYKVRVE